MHSLDCLGWVSANTLLAVHRLQPIPLGTCTYNCSFPQNHWMSKYYLILPHEANDSETVLHVAYHISVFSAVFDMMANLWILLLHKVSLYAKKVIQAQVRGVKICKHWDIKVTFSSLYCCAFCTYVSLRNFSGFGLQWNLDTAFIGSIDYMYMYHSLSRSKPSTLHGYTDSSYKIFTLYNQKLICTWDVLKSQK